MGTPQFPNLGQNCSFEGCGLNDFLPFTCDRCSKVLCLDHRGYAAHCCPNAASADSTVIICPLCGTSIKLVASEDPNEVWHSHTRKECNPEKYNSAVQKRRCPVKGCKEILRTSSTVRCKACAQDVCLRHRFGPDHACPGRVLTSASGFPTWAEASDLGARLVGQWASLASGVGGASELQTRGSASNGQLAKGSGQEIKQSGQGRGKSQAKVSQSPSASTPGLSALEGLTDWANSVRGTAERRMQGRGGGEVCPQCNACFGDAVSLVEHVKRAHEGQATEQTCTVS